jgi:guanylate kinase
MKKKGMIFVISAPSGTGKTTVINEFLKGHRNDFSVSVSVTTRQPRKGEINGRDYYFFTKEKFRDYVKKGRFLEHATILDNYYGTLRETVLKTVNSGRNVIMDIDVQGAGEIRKKVDCITIFIVPPSFKELSRRLLNRRTESAAAVKNRLALAKKELKERSKYDYIIVNDKLADATGYLENIYAMEMLSRAMAKSKRRIYEKV